MDIRNRIGVEEKQGILDKRSRKYSSKFMQIASFSKTLRFLCILHGMDVVRVRKNMILYRALVAYFPKRIEIARKLESPTFVAEAAISLTGLLAVHIMTTALVKYMCRLDLVKRCPSYNHTK